MEWQVLVRPDAPLVSSMTEGEVANRTNVMDDSIMAVLCETCQAEITDEEAADGVVHMAGAYWHMECFTCITCGRPVPFEQDNVLLVGSQPMCGGCTFNCISCGSPITDEVVLCGQDPYHTACFRCSACDQKMDAQSFSTVDGKVRCENCQDRSDVLLAENKPPLVHAEVEQNRQASPFHIDSAYHQETPYEASKNTTELPSEDARASHAPGDSQKHERLSDAIQSEILQVYYSSHNDGPTPPQEEIIQRNTTSHTSVSSTVQDLWTRVHSVTESDILRSLSMHDSEFEALISTPEFSARRSSIFGTRSPYVSGSISNSIKRSPVLDDHASSTSWSGSHPENATALLDEISQLQMQRHIALAELLSVQSAQQQHQSSDDKSVQNRVNMVLTSLLAHLDTIKGEYRRELESLLLMQHSVRQELKPMMQVRNTLMQESQSLAERIDEMTEHLSQLESQKDFEKMIDRRPPNEEIMPDAASDTRESFEETGSNAPAVSKELASGKTTSLSSSCADQSEHVPPNTTLEKELPAQDKAEDGASPPVQVPRNDLVWPSNEPDTSISLEDTASLSSTGPSNIPSAVTTNDPVAVTPAPPTRAVPPVPKVEKVPSSSPVFIQSATVPRNESSSSFSSHGLPSSSHSSSDRLDGIESTRSIPTPTPSVQAPSNNSSSPTTGLDRRDASLPPLPSPRKFRWIRPRIPNVSDLNAFGETLLLPAHELTRPLRLSSSPGGVSSGSKVSNSFERQNEYRSAATSPAAANSTPEQMPSTSPHSSATPTLAPPVSALFTIPLTQDGPPLPARSKSHVTYAPQEPHVSTSPQPKVSMMGRPLCEQAELDGSSVPQLVRRCLEAIELHGLSDEGLYRKSGSTQQQRHIVQLFDNGASFDLCDEDQFNDISAITGVLKSYLRQLPEPLVPYSMHEKYIHIMEIPDALSIPAMRLLLEQLPKPHYHTLQRLCTHLKVVHDHSHQTRMTARNLAIVFGPTIMHAREPSVELIETPIYARAVEFLIEHEAALFANQHT